MKNGTYKYALEMMVPLGKRRGLLELKVSNNKVGGFLTMFTQRLPLETAILNGTELSFAGEMKTLMYPLKYNVHRPTVENRLSYYIRVPASAGSPSLPQPVPVPCSWRGCRWRV